MNPKSSPWYRHVTREQWRAFLATFLGWLLDGFDFTIMTFILIDIQNSFTIDRALAGALGTVTLLFRLVGGFGAGIAADKWGRKGPLMLSILWFSIFAFLSGFSTSYAMLFAFRALFGIGMGGEWAAGMPLALEHWPVPLSRDCIRVAAGGLVLGIHSLRTGFHFIYPVANQFTDPFSDAVGATLGWRVMFWSGVIPALLVLWIRSGVNESPVWLERRRQLEHRQVRDTRETVSVIRLFRRGLLWTTVQTSLLMSVFMFSYYSITFWYPTFLREASREPLWYLIALNLGAIIGMAFWGQMSETRLGRRGAVSIAALMGVLALPLYLAGASTEALWGGALLMGATGTGVWGMAPAYLMERFPTAVRGVGAGLSYHVGAAVGSMTPLVMGNLQDEGFSLSGAMALCVTASGLLVASLIWLGPETRGREFTNIGEENG